MIINYVYTIPFITNLVKIALAMNNLTKHITVPYWLLFTFILFLFLPFSFALNISPTIDLPLARLGIIGIFGLYILWSLKERLILIDYRPRFWLLVLFLLITACSYFWAIDHFRASRKILFLWSFFPIYLIIFTLSQNQIWQEKLLKILSWSAFLAATFGLLIFSLQFVLGLNPTLNLISEYLAPFFLGQNFSETVLTFPSWLVNISGTTLLRVFGSFPDPHLFALYLNMILPLPIFLYFKNNQKKYLFFTGIILLASLLTFSRAAYFSLIVAMGMFFLFNNSLNIIKKNSLLLNLGLTVTVLLFIVPNPLISRLLSSFNPTEGSNQGRLAMWQAGWEMTLTNPLIGVGIGNFSRALEPMSQYRDPIYAHNLFLDFSSETGLPNTLFFFFALLAPLVSCSIKPTPLNQVLALSLIIFLVHSLFETPVYSTHIFPLLLTFLAIKPS